MKERSASKDLHFGHFKAVTQHTSNLLLHYTLAEIPFRTRHSLESWKQATDMMILKQEGD